MTERVGQKLGNYHLVSLLGQGGFADVYLGEHIHLKSLAAIKVLHTRLTDELRESFLNEARILAHLIHPHIIRTLEFGLESDSIPFLVMDYAPHGTIRQHHPSHTRVPLAIVAKYVKQIADGLQYAHDRKLIHRDLKPDNLLIGQAEQLLLSDFGVAMISQATTRSQTAEKEISGTMAYMAPEQLQGKPTFASDQYALGIMVYEWLCGTRPFQGTVAEIFNQHLSVAPEPLRQYSPELSPAIEQVVFTALEKDPRRRFPDVKAFATAFELASQSPASQAIRSGVAQLIADQSTVPLAAVVSSKTPTLLRDEIVPPTIVAPPRALTHTGNGVTTPAAIAQSNAPALISDAMVSPTIIATPNAPTLISNGALASPVAAPPVSGVFATMKAPDSFATPVPALLSAALPWAEQGNIAGGQEFQGAWLSPSQLSLLDRPVPKRRLDGKMLLIVGLVLLVLLGTSAFAVFSWKSQGNRGSGVAGTHNAGSQSNTASSGNLRGNNSSNSGNNDFGNNGSKSNGPASTPTAGATSAPPTAAPQPTSKPTPTPTPKPCTYYDGWEMHPDGGTTGSDVFTVSGNCGGAVYAIPTKTPTYPTQMRIMYLLPGATSYSYSSWVNFTSGEWIKLQGGLPMGTQFKLQARNSGTASYYTIYGDIKY